ncbi:variable surface protein [Plasmodium gonderi]|uniref:Variable surface protein n=1 Tax=Plasmodium gonderi TaxID=77519 RepID=A0A1Y1JHM9_PLAGO|nr:variable surface protein [Plasmodium gonderi]GAW82039.1 variable surface protein [Plasmodium gonderi]
METLTEDELILPWKRHIIEYVSFLLLNFQENLLKKLPAHEGYKKLEEEVNGNEHDSKCNDLGSDATVKNICTKFLRNIKDLIDSKINKKEHTDKTLCLIYWILDELRKHVSHNSRIINGVDINKIVHVGNRFYREHNPNVLFYDYELDLEKSKEEKHLYDYFKNYDKLIKCDSDDCKTYLKYVNYIKKIYYKHKMGCMWWNCDYFNFHEKYYPHVLISLLKEKINKFNNSEKNGNPGENSEQSSGSKSSKTEVGMKIKYIYCSKINDTDITLNRYKCEDPAYRQHSEKKTFGKPVKKGPHGVSTLQALRGINDSRCMAVYDNKNNFLGLNCNATRYEHKNELKYTNMNNKETMDPKDGARKLVDSKKEIKNSEDSVNVMPGTELFSAYRYVSSKDIEHGNIEEESTSDLHSIQPVTLFPEVLEEERKRYMDPIDHTCEYYISKEDEIVCVKKLKVDDYTKNVKYNDFTITNKVAELIIRETDGLLEVLDKNSITSNFSINRILTVVALIVGTFIVLFFYIKFTPLGYYLRKHLLKRRKVNNNIYKKNTSKIPSRNKKSYPINSQKERIQISYQYK